MSWFERLLRKVFPHREIGWEDIGEKFTRFTLLYTPWFRLYLHKLEAPRAHLSCHDHPWNFIALLLSGGYWELQDHSWCWRRPGNILLRPARTRHNVVTNGVSWSVILTGRKFRSWGLTEDCHTPVKT